MARRRIGQERLRLGHDQSRRSGSVDEIAGLIDWADIDRLLASIHASAKGEPATFGPVQGPAAVGLVRSVGREAGTSAGGSRQLAPLVRLVRLAAVADHLRRSVTMLKAREA